MRDEGADVMPPVVAIASSAGGISALQTIVAALPGDLAAAVLIVQHLDREHRSVLPEILARKTALRVQTAQAGARIEPGVIYVGPPDEHLLLNTDRTISLAHTELVHFVRPSADLLFESVAVASGERALAVVLTGSGSDGALGTGAIKTKGGTVIAQDEATSEYFGMPRAAIEAGSIDQVLALEAIAGAMMSFVEGCLV